MRIANSKYYQKQLVPIIFLGICLSQLSFAATSREKLWSLITINGSYHNFVYTAEPQVRFVTPGILFQQFLANTGMGYRFSSDWELWLGQTISADSQDAVPGSADEYRLWQQILWRHGWAKFGLLSRTRLEERRSLNFPNWSYRLRQRLVFNKPITENFSLVVYDEAFVSLNKVFWIITNTFDQNRAYIGVEQRVSRLMYFGAGYMNQFLSTSVPQFDNVLVLGLRVELDNAN